MFPAYSFSSGPAAIALAPQNLRRFQTVSPFMAQALPSLPVQSDKVWIPSDAMDFLTSTVNLSQPAVLLAASSSAAATVGEKLAISAQPITQTKNLTGSTTDASISPFSDALAQAMLAPQSQGALQSHSPEVAANPVDVELRRAMRQSAVPHAMHQSLNAITLQIGRAHV